MSDRKVIEFVNGCEYDLERVHSIARGLYQMTHPLQPCRHRVVEFGFLLSIGEGLIVKTRLPGVRALRRRTACWHFPRSDGQTVEDFGWP